ncbi:MAG TPA: Ig-like domain-containing protein, partial [Rubrobacteraceae bacterium]|nr:Ig-like domain-containing protein [Rubrobacteraceae bacterium]
YTPRVNANGTANVQVVARDSGGTANGGDNTSDAQSFTITVIDGTAPTVRTITPTDGSTGVSPTANVRATFSEAMNEASVEATDPTTGKPTTFTLRRAGTSTTVAAIVTYNATTRTATLNPGANLRLGATYIATVRTGAKDLAGNALDQNPNTAGNQPKTLRFTVRT